MSKHIGLTLCMAAAALPAWAGPLDLVFRELDVSIELSPSGLPPVVNTDRAVVIGPAPVTVEVFRPAGGNVVGEPFREPGFISAAGTAPGGMAVGANVLFIAGTSRANPANVATAIAFDAQTVANTTDAPFTVGADFFVPAPTLTVLEFGNALAPPDPKLPRAVAFFELTTVLTRVDGSNTSKQAYLYGVETFRSTRTADVLAQALGSATGLQFSTTAIGGQVFSVPELTLRDFPVGELLPGESLEVKGRYFAQVGSGFGETGAAAFIGDPNNLSASSARLTLETLDGIGPSDPPPGPTPVPAPAGWAVLAAALAGLGAARRRA